MAGVRRPEKTPTVKPSSWVTLEPIWRITRHLHSAFLSLKRRCAREMSTHSQKRQRLQRRGKKRSIHPSVCVENMHSPTR